MGGCGGVGWTPGTRRAAICCGRGSGVTVVSILFSSVQDYYLLTAFGPVAFWLARPWVEASGEGNRLPRWTLTGPGLALLATGLLTLGFAGFLRLRGMDGGPAASLDAHGARDQILGTLAGFTAADWQRLLPLVWATGGLFLAGGVAVWTQATRGRRPAALAVTALMMLGVLALAATGMRILEDYFSLKRTCLLINQTAPPDALVVCYGPTINSPSLLYYLDREVYWLGANPGRGVCLPGTRDQHRSVPVGGGVWQTLDGRRSRFPMRRRNGFARVTVQGWHGGLANGASRPVWHVAPAGEQNQIRIYHRGHGEGTQRTQRKKEGPEERRQASLAGTRAFCLFLPPPPLCPPSVSTVRNSGTFSVVAWQTHWKSVQSGMPAPKKTAPPLKMPPHDPEELRDRLNQPKVTLEEARAQFQRTMSLPRQETLARRPKSVG